MKRTPRVEGRCRASQYGHRLVLIHLFPDDAHNDLGLSLVEVSPAPDHRHHVLRSAPTDRRTPQSSAFSVAVLHPQGHLCSCLIDCLCDLEGATERWVTTFSVRAEQSRRRSSQPTCADTARGWEEQDKSSHTLGPVAGSAQQEWAELGRWPGWALAGRTSCRATRRQRSSCSRVRQQSSTD